MSNALARNDTESGTLKNNPSQAASPSLERNNEEKISENENEDLEQAVKTHNTPFSPKKKLDSSSPQLSSKKKDLIKKMTETISIYDDHLSDTLRFNKNEAKKHEDGKIRESNASILDQIHSIQDSVY